jgi:hypothetical protein
MVSCAHIMKIYLSLNFGFNLIVVATLYEDDCLLEFCSGHLVVFFSSFLYNSLFFIAGCCEHDNEPSGSVKCW